MNRSQQPSCLPEEQVAEVFGLNGHPARDNALVEQFGDSAVERGDLRLGRASSFGHAQIMTDP